MTSATIAAPDRRIGSWPVIGWLPMLVLPAGVLVTAPGAWPPWAHMWLLAIAIYASWKWLSWYAAPASAGPWWRHALYLALWPGLDAPAFLGTGKSARAIAPARGEWGLAAMNLAVGIALLWVVAPQIPPGYELLLGWVGMAGIVFVLHFGGVHLLSCAYRSCGINARPLMDWPIAATSVSDFWGRRWNTAFRDFTHRFVFRPLLARIGPAWSIVVGFLASGLVHDLVISLPARDGYGWPTLYFLLQGAAIYFERSPLGKRLGLGRGWRGWLFAAVVIAGPAYFLFHPPFVQNVIVPFLEVIGAT